MLLSAAAKYAHFLIVGLFAVSFLIYLVCRIWVLPVSCGTSRSSTTGRPHTLLRYVHLLISFLSPSCVLLSAACSNFGTVSVLVGVPGDTGRQEEEDVATP